MKLFKFITVVIVTASVISCKPGSDSVRREDTNPVPARPVVIGGWKLGLPGPSENALTYNRRVEVEPADGRILLPADGSLVYKLAENYVGFVWNSLAGVIRRSDNNDEPLTAATIYYYTFYTEPANRLCIRMRCEAQLNGESGNIFETVYEVETNRVYTPMQDGYPSDGDMLMIFEAAIGGIAKRFEDDPRWTMQ